MWLRADVVVAPLPLVVVVVVVVVANEELDDWPQTTSRLDLLLHRTMRADIILSKQHTKQTDKQIRY